MQRYRSNKESIGDKFTFKKGQIRHDYFLPLFDQSLRGALLNRHRLSYITPNDNLVHPKRQLHLHAEVKIVTIRGKSRYIRW